MERRIEIVNWVTAADAFLCIILHRMLLVQSERGEVTALVANLFQISLIAFMLFFMAVCAGVAVYAWKKVNVVPGSMDKPPAFPKMSFTAAAVAIIIFTLYWMI